MVVKKPYGFLIKHFKLIHLLLLIPMFYIALKFGDISSFFKDYVKNRYTSAETTIAGNYITTLTYLALFFMILSNLVIYFLMKSKKKKVTFYLVSIIYYILLIVSTIVFYATMSSIETGTSNSTFINFVRDLARLSVYPSYILMILDVLKGIGFNFKTLRLDNNLDLQVTDEDEEEIEIKINPDTINVKKRAIHFIREMKYYILENKFVFSCLGLVFGLLVFITLYMEIEVYNKKYNVNQAFALDTFTMTLKDSYLTNVDYKGEKIDKDTYFLAIKIGIFNKNIKVPNNPEYGVAKIDKANFRIFLDNEVLYPNFARSGRFIDIGNKYEGENIYPQSSDDYVLVYELNSKQLKKQYQMKILSGLKQEPGKLIPSYKIINIRPKDVLKEEDIGEVKINTDVDLKATMLGDSKYKLESFEIVNNYNYEYEQCKQVSNCKKTTGTVVPKAGNTLVIIKDELSLDEETSYYKNSKARDIYYDFGSIKYTYTLSNSNEEKDYTTKLRNVTPAGVKDVKIYEVSNMLLRSKNIKIIFNIRNQKLTIDTGK